MLVGLVALQPREEPAAARGEDRRRQLPARARQVVGQHPPAPEVLGAEAIAFVELQHDERRADLFAGAEAEPGRFLPGDHAHAAGIVAEESGLPLPGPAHHHDHALLRPREVEIRERPGGGPAAGRREPVLRARLHTQLMGLIAVGRAVVARVMVQRELALRVALEAGVEGLERLQDGRLRSARVFHEHGPLHHREITVLDGHAADRQAGPGIGQREGMLGAVPVELSGSVLAIPGLQQLRRGLAVEGEGKEGLRGVRAALRRKNRQLAEPRGGAVGQGDLGVDPGRLVAGDPVARVAHFEQKLRSAVQLDADGRRRHAFVEHGGAEGLFAGYVDRADDAPAPRDRHVVAVDAHRGGEDLARPGQAHGDPAVGVAVEAAGVDLAAELERQVGVGIRSHGAVGAEDVESGPKRLGLRRLLDLRRHPGPRFGQFRCAGRDRERAAGA